MSGMMFPVISLNSKGLQVAESGSAYDNPLDSPPQEKNWIEVLIDITFGGELPPEEGEKLFTYRIPPQMDVQPGDIVSVPFGSQQVGAIAIRFVDNLPKNLRPEQVKMIEEVITRGFFPSHYWQLLNQVSLYYCTPLIKVIRAGLPPGLLRKSQRRVRLISTAIPLEWETFVNPISHQLLTQLKNSPHQDYSWQYLQSKIPRLQQAVKDLSKRGWVESYLEPPTPPQVKLRQAVTLIPHIFPEDLTPRQSQVIEILRQQGGEMWFTDCIQIAQTSSPLIKTLEKKGYILIEEREILRREQGIDVPEDQAKLLTPEQSEAVNLINNLSKFSQVLLHGITGSGKTEIYLQVIEPLIKQGKSALVLVPEIGLTPQLTDRFRARFGKKVCVYHSELSSGERYDTWRYMLQGVPQIVIGTRSAVFAPLPHLGIIILDEEHDSSFKQDQPSPCYHARKVAKWRAELENCPLILGSATPSLESWTEIKYPSVQPHSQTYYLSLPQRIYARPLPPIEVVDLRQELKQGNRSIFSFSLQNACQQLLANKQQGIFFIHRRGHSTFVSCRNCGYVIDCPHCDVSLAYHHTHEGATELLRCHYCNHVELHPKRCPDCNSPYLKHFGSGTQKVAQELKILFPKLRVIRFDSDTTQAKNSRRNLLTQFAQGQADILLGTQMLTKGLDLEQVTLVGIISADGLLHFSDYLAQERAFQILTQVAGRAGRGNDPGRVILQTYTPEHPVIQAVQAYAYESFIEQELKQREQLNYPPFSQLILLKLSSLDGGKVEETAYNLAHFIKKETPEEGYELLGPAPAPILRISNHYRWHILLKLFPSYPRELLQLTQLRQLCPNSVSLTIDVDPLYWN